MAAKKRSRGLSVKAMKAAINGMTKDLGMPPIKFEPDADLQLFWRGPPLKLSELQALPNGSVVWVTYKEHGEERYRMNGAMRISREEESADYWLEDGSSFAGEFRPAENLGKDEGCYDTCFGEAEMYLFHAEAITEDEKKARINAQKRLVKLLEDIQNGGPAAKKALASLKKPWR